MRAKLQATLSDNQQSRRHISASLEVLRDLGHLEAASSDYGGAKLHMALQVRRGFSMKVSHVHCRVRDLPAAARRFQQVLQVTTVFNNERMVWLGFGEFGLILDAAPTDTVLTLGFDSDDCDADFRTLTGRGAEIIEAPQDKPWGARSAYLKGPGALTVEIEQVLKSA